MAARIALFELLTRASKLYGRSPSASVLLSACCPKSSSVCFVNKETSETRFERVRISKPSAVPNADKRTEKMLERLFRLRNARENESKQSIQEECKTIENRMAEISKAILLFARDKTLDSTPSHLNPRTVSVGARTVEISIASRRKPNKKLLELKHARDYLSRRGECADLLSFPTRAPSRFATMASIPKNEACEIVRQSLQVSDVPTTGTTTTHPECDPTQVMFSDMLEKHVLPLMRSEHADIKDRMTRLSDEMIETREKEIARFTEEKERVRDAIIEQARRLGMGADVHTADDDGGEDVFDSFIVKCLERA